MSVCLPGTLDGYRQQCRPKREFAGVGLKIGKKQVGIVNNRKLRWVRGAGMKRDVPTVVLLFIKRATDAWYMTSKPYLRGDKARAILEFNGLPELGRNWIVHTSNRHDAAVEDERLVAGVQEDLVHPQPDRGLVKAVAIGDAHPWVRPHGEFVLVMRAGHRSDGHEAFLQEH